MQSAQQTFAIQLSRLPKVGDAPGLILLTVAAPEGAEAPKKVGALTDAALRGRLAHFDAHSANEISALRKALSQESGKATIYERWPRLDGCLQFWHSFVGSRIRALAWTCEKCSTTERENVGGSSGECFLRRCKCGQVNRITVPK